MSDNDDLFKRSVIASADTTFLMNSDGAVTLDGEGVKTVSNLDIDHVAFAVRCNKEAADGAVNGMQKGFKVLSKVFVKFPDDAARTALFEDEARSTFANSINPDIPQDVLHLNLGVWYEQQTKQGPTHKHFNATKGLGHSIMIPRVRVRVRVIVPWFEIGVFITDFRVKVDPPANHEDVL